MTDENSKAWPENGDELLIVLELLTKEELRTSFSMDEIVGASELTLKEIRYCIRRLLDLEVVTQVPNLQDMRTVYYGLIKYNGDITYRVRRNGS